MSFRERANPTVMTCSACGSRCRRYWTSLMDPGWRGSVRVLVGLAVWMFAVAPFVVVGPGLWPLVLGFPGLIALRVAQDRLYHALWLWRHPARCQGGGEPEPVKSAA